MSNVITDKQTAILQATLDLIAENGFHNAPMSLVAKRSGVSIGIIYHYFAGKDELIKALYSQIKLKFAEALVKSEPQKLPYPQHLKIIWLNAFHFYVSHPKETLFLEQYENSPYQQAWDIKIADANSQILGDLILKDFAAGLIKPMPFEVFNDLSLGVAVSLAKRQIAGTISLTEAMLEEIASACCRAVEP